MKVTYTNRSLRCMGLGLAYLMFVQSIRLIKLKGF